MEKTALIHAQVNGAIATLLLDRPARRNAFDRAMSRALADAIEAAHDDPAVRVIVIKGATDVFSTGRDLKAAATGSEADDPQARASAQMAEDDAWLRIFQLLLRAPIPSVAVVRGMAVAGGFTLAMGCDFVLADRAATFGAYEMRHGFPAAVCTPLLTRLVGPRLALEFAMFGLPIAPERLHAAGLINRLADGPDELARIEAEFVDHIAGLDRRAMQQTRELLRAAETMPIDRALDMGRNLNELIGATGGFARAGAKLGTRNRSEHS